MSGPRDLFHCPFAIVAIRVFTKGLYKPAFRESHVVKGPYGEQASLDSILRSLSNGPNGSVTLQSGGKIFHQLASTIMQG